MNLTKSVDGSPPPLPEATTWFGSSVSEKKSFKRVRNNLFSYFLPLEKVELSIQKYYCIFLAAPEGVRVYFLVNPGKWRAAVALLPTSKYSIGAVLYLSPVMVHLF